MGDYAERFAGVILTMLGLILLLQYAQGGYPQVKRWLSAKFLGDPS